MDAGTYTSLYPSNESFAGYLDAVRAHPDFGEPNIPINVRYGIEDGGFVEALTYHFHIARLDAKDTEIVADVCDDLVYAEDKERLNGHNHGFSWAVTLRNTTDTPGLPGIADTDPGDSHPNARRIPDWNIFDTWKIVEMTPLGREPQSDAEVSGCHNWWMERHPDARISGPFVISPPGVFPGTPVAPQYPEWIGPANTE